MNAPGIDYLLQLQQIIDSRRTSTTDESYTAQLFAAGTSRMAQKVGEEGVEVAIAAVQGDKPRVKAEAADLLYHLIVLLRSQDLSLQDVAAELAQRRAASQAKHPG
jgi:phosphoribosyl-ATP pyrophosphohydrolase/phosphoribosyl-AMP cyclohydrolase